MKKIPYYILLTSMASVLTAISQTAPPGAATPAEPAPAVAAPAEAPAAPAATAEPVATTDRREIRLTDVKITGAIENLARAAGINYMLDPKIGYGVPDANGQIKAEPELSIRWENITPENALHALLDNYGLQMIQDKSTGIARITLKDPAAPPPLITRVVQLKYSSVDTMKEAVTSVLSDKRSKVLPDTRTSQLIVVATDPEQQVVDTLIAQLDKPTRQVLIETRLIEVSSNPETRKGINWQRTLQSHNISAGNYQGDLGDTLNPLDLGTMRSHSSGPLNPSSFMLTSDGLGAVLSFFNSSKEAQIMSTPRVVTLDNTMATISVIKGYPVINVQGGTQLSAGGSQIAYTNVGTILHVTPRITANDNIWLKVNPEVSSFAGDKTQEVGGGSEGKTQTISAPTFEFRIIDTQVLIPNANTLVLGGLVQDKPFASRTKVPLLGDIPGIGGLFRSEQKNMEKQNLLIFITPTIVKDTDFQEGSKSSSFFKSEPTGMKQVMDPNSTWDGSSIKGHWSDPITETTK